MNVLKTTGLFIKTLSDHIISATHEEYLEYAQNCPADTQGWVRVVYPDGYVADIHFRCKEIGKPHFSNAHFDTTDIEVITRAIGVDAAAIFLANHI